MFYFIVGFFLVKCDNCTILLSYFCIVYYSICKADLVKDRAVPYKPRLVWMDKVSDLVNEL